MAASLLILGGTREASDLARVVAIAGLSAVFSYAGRVADPIVQPLPTRIGGFGGIDGLADYLRQQSVTHVVDATHPFAAGMSRNAIAACAQADVALIALSRPAWEAGSGDQWQHVGDMETAVAALEGPARRVFLAIGRQGVEAFGAQPQHRYLLRFVDPPLALPLPDCHVEVARGPFDLAGDRALLQEQAIDLIVTKNSGGDGARAKIDAARELGLPVLMIDRPFIPARRESGSIGEVMDWLTHTGTERGV